MSDNNTRSIILSRAKVNGSGYIFTEQEEFSPGFYPDFYHSTNGGMFYKYRFTNELDNSLLLIYCNKELDINGQKDLLSKWTDRPD